MLELKQGAYSLTQYAELHEVIAEVALQNQREQERLKNDIG